MNNPQAVTDSGPETVTLAWTFTHDGVHKTMWSRTTKENVRTRTAALSLTDGVSDMHVADPTEFLPPEGEIKL